MNEQIDTSDGAPLNTQAAVSDRYGSTLTSDRASVGHPSTGDAPHPVRGRANGNSRTAPVGVSQQPRPRRRTRTTICVDAVDRGIGRALRWGKNNWMSLIDVALTVAGTFVLELHWRNAVRVCVWMIGDTGDCGYGCMNYAFEIRELHFSEAWLQWVQAEAVLKILIAGACVGRWCRENNAAFERGRTFLMWIQGTWCFVGICMVVMLNFIGGDSCMKDLDEPIFQLCLVMLIATLLKFINDVIFSWRESYELWRDTKCMVLFLSMTVLLLLTNSLVFGLLQEPRVLLCLCLATSSLWLLRRLLRPLVRLLEQRDWRRWQRWRQQQAGQAGALLAPTLDPILEQQRRDFTPLNRNVGATVTQEGIGGMLPDTPSQRQQQPYQQQQHRQPPESQRMSAEQDQTDRLPFTTC